MLYTWIASCTDQVRFFSMRDRPFFSMMALLFVLRGSCATCDSLLLPCSFRYRRTASFRSTALLATAFFCSPRYRVRDKPNIDIDSDQIKSTMVLYSSLRSEPLGNGPYSWISTASAVRYYTVIQSLLDCCGSLLSCQRSCCASR